MKKQVILLLIILLAFIGNSQNIESGNNLIEPPIEVSIDTFKISKTIKIAKDYYKNNKLDSSYYHYNTALEKAISINSKPQIAECLYWIAVYFELTNKYQQAISYYLKASVAYEELNNIEKLAIIENYIGYNYFILNLDDKAIEYYFKSLKSYNSISDDDGVALNYIDIGNLYYNQENYTFAKRYFEDALAIYLELDDKSGIAVCYTNLANVISDSGNIPEGIEYFFKSIEIEEELNDEAGIAVNYNNIGDNYLKQGDYEKADNYFTKSLKIAKKVEDKGLMAILYLNYSELNNKLNAYNKAVFYGKQSLNISRKIGDLDIELEALKNISLAYEKLGSTAKALSFIKKHETLNDSLIKIDRNKKVQLFNALNELEKSNFTIDELSTKSKIAQLKYENEKKISYVLIIAMLVFAVLIVILIYQQTSIKKAYNLLEFKNHQIKRMNDEIRIQTDNLKKLNNTKDKFFSIIAHDLKNPFNSIKGFTELLIENMGNYDEEKRLKFLKIIKGSTSKASSLLNNLLIWANSQSGNLNFNPKRIEIVKQVSDVISLLEIQAINKEIKIYNNVHHNLYVNADENMLNTILRNLISNAIKFCNQQGSINIISTFDANFIEISIKDNGVGMSKETIDNLFDIENKTSRIGTANEQGSGLGLFLCKEFVEKHGGKIWVESIVNEGSIFKFTIPIINAIEEFEND